MPPRMAAAALLLPMLLGGCAGWLPDPMRVEVQQGNVLSSADLERLEPGLPRARVRELLGEPVLSTPFHQNRWDYVYYKTEAGRGATPERLTLYFEGDALARVEDRYQSPEDPLPALADGPLPDVETAAPAGGRQGPPDRTSPLPGPQ